MLPSQYRLAHQTPGRAIEVALNATLRDACTEHMVEVQDPLFPASLEDVRIHYRHTYGSRTADCTVELVIDGRHYERTYKHDVSEWRYNLDL